MKKFTQIAILCMAGLFGPLQALLAQTGGSNQGFAVTFPNSAITFTSGNQMEVRWNVAGTDQAPFLLSQVKISLSTDGGQTFSQVLNPSTANDGVELVQVPNAPTIQGRIQISCLGGEIIANSAPNFNIQAAQGRVATPVISPGTSNFSGPFNCIISCATPDAKIYYSTNGNSPVPGTHFTKVYSGPFAVMGNTTVRALAMRQNWTTSLTSAAFYTFPNTVPQAQVPTTSHPSGTYTGAQSVSLHSQQTGASIFYTTNGNTPVIGTTFTRLYTSPFQVSATSTIRAMAVVSGMSNSPILVSNLTLNNAIQLTAPVISPGTSNFSSTATVTITNANPAATIYYSITGNIPVPGAFHTQIYTQPFTISASTTVRAIATLPSAPNTPPIPNSPVSVAFLTLQMPIAATPVINLPSGNYSGLQNISISTSTPDAQIYYTTNGNVPVVGTSFTRLYTGPMTVFNTTTIRAITVKQGLQNSNVAAAFISFVGGRKSLDPGLEEFEASEFRVFPNPGKNIINIRGLEGKAKEGKIQVFNALGTLVYQQSVDLGQDEIQLDLGELKAGMYFIKETSTQKMKRWMRK
jgi:hypothetical protein